MEQVEQLSPGMRYTKKDERKKEKLNQNKKEKRNV